MKDSTSHFAWCWDEIHGRFPFRFNSWLVGHGEEYCSTLDSFHWVRRNVKKKRGVSSVNWDPVCIRDWVVSCVKVCKSRIKSDLLEPCIWLTNILNKDLIYFDIWPSYILNRLIRIADYLSRPLVPVRLVKHLPLQRENLAWKQLNKPIQSHFFYL